MTDPETGKWAFIVNPVAGNGFAATILPELKRNLEKRNIQAEIALTERYGHATELSERFLNTGYTHIIGVGGDGTMNEISRPLIGHKDVITGLIPAGTGNDFIQILGFPDRFSDREWDIFFEGKTAEIDTGNCNGKIFLNGMGLGFDAEVAAENYTEPGKVKKGGKNKYIWHIVKTLLFFREKKMKVTVNGNEAVSTDCFINTIASGRRFAGGFLLTPEAIADDGLLDVCMIRKLNLFQRFSMLMKVPSGKHINESKVNYYKTDRISLEFKSEVPFHVDGELFFSSRFDVSVKPSSLKIIYNPHGNNFLSRQ
jgi:YegS/Rv2252/BmrU family lipid kinase